MAALVTYRSQRDGGSGTGGTTVGTPAAADTAAASPSPSPAPGTLLTRADSMAIADAVRRQVARENAAAARSPSRGPATLNTDSLTKAIERLMLDSLLRLSRLDLDERLARIPGFEGRVFTAVPPAVAGGPRATGPRQVRVIGRRSSAARFAEAEAVLVDSVRRRLARTPGLVVLGDAAREPEPPSQPEIVVSVRFSSVGNDSVQARVDLIDPLAAPSFLHRVVQGEAAPASDPLRHLRDVVGSTAATLVQMTRAPRGAAQVWRIRPPEETSQD
jgi:hypothetical protein